MIVRNDVPLPAKIGPLQREPKADPTYDAIKVLRVGECVLIEVTQDEETKKDPEKVKRGMAMHLLNKAKTFQRRNPDIAKDMTFTTRVINTPVVGAGIWRTK